MHRLHEPTSLVKSPQSHLRVHSRPGQEVIEDCSSADRKQEADPALASGPCPPPPVLAGHPQACCQEGERRPSSSCLRFPTLGLWEVRRSLGQPRIGGLQPPEDPPRGTGSQPGLHWWCRWSDWRVDFHGRRWTDGQNDRSACTSPPGSRSPLPPNCQGGSSAPSPNQPGPPSPLPCSGMGPQPSGQGSIPDSISSVTPALLWSL